MESTARLLVRLGAQPEHEYPLTQEITIIGREALNDLVINDPEVSRRHCRIMLRPDGFLLEDLGSTNGTFVNGQRVTAPQTLYHGDTIELGKSVRIAYLGTAPISRSELPDDEPEEEEPEDDDEEFYIRPEAAPVVVPATADDEDLSSGWRRYLISCGCLTLLLIFLMVSALFIIDRTAPDLLYCGPLKSFWELMLSLFNRTLACPAG